MHAGSSRTTAVVVLVSQAVRQGTRVQKGAPGRLSRGYSSASKQIRYELKMQWSADMTQRRASLAHL